MPIFSPRFKQLLITLALGTGFCILWSSAFPMGKMAVAYSPPLSFLSFRFLLAGLVMIALVQFAVLVKIKKLRFSRDEIIIGIILGLLNNAIYLGLCWKAFETTSASMVAIIVGLNPLTTAIIAYFWIKEALTPRRICGIVLGLGGGWWLIYTRMGLDIHNESSLGVIYSAIAVFSLSFGTVLYRRYGVRQTAPTPESLGQNPDQNKGRAWRLNLMQNLAAGVALLPFAAFEPWGQINWGMNYLLLMAYAVFAISILALAMWFALIRRIGAGGASSFHFMNPAMALAFSYWLLGETATMAELIALIPILLGILLVNWPAVKLPRAARASHP